ncbi:MAG TPA: hypothetical protein VLJ76_07735 [Gaiellaceae bacterium]|nr:hypothetical protein [Gaiellaceae bacterium]
MRAILVAAAATATAGLLAGTVLGASARTSQIAFTKNRAIWVIGADGSGLRQVTRGGYSDGGVAWSRDGALIAFTRYSRATGCGEDQTRGDLYLVGANGKSQRRLTTTGCMFSPPSHPAFAPKGNKLAFDDDKGILVAQGPDWKPHVVLAHGLFPSWAPDARRLVESNDPTAVEVLDTVTHATRALGQGDFPEWSHDGKRIACVFSGNQIWTTDPAGGHRVHVTTATGHISALAWSPDDKHLVYSDSVTTSSSSWVVPSAGGKVVALGEGQFPQWSPDEKQISLESRDGWIYLTRPNGLGRHRLVQGFGAAWSPNA